MKNNCRFNDSGLIENSSNTDLTITLVYRTFSEARQMFMDDDDGGQDFTVDMELTKEEIQIYCIRNTDVSLSY